MAGLHACGAAGGRFWPGPGAFLVGRLAPSAGSDQEAVLAPRGAVARWGSDPARWLGARSRRSTARAPPRASGWVTAAGRAGLMVAHPARSGGGLPSSGSQCARPRRPHCAGGRGWGRGGYALLGHAPAMVLTSGLLQAPMWCVAAEGARVGVMRPVPLLLLPLLISRCAEHRVLGESSARFSLGRQW
jgi:hypothetical protein